MDQVQAVLFDFDGLIVDTETLYRRAWTRILREGSEDAFDRLAAGRREEDAVILMKDLLLPSFASPDAALAVKRSEFFRLSSDAAALVAMPHITELINQLRPRHTLHIVSNSEADSVTRFLKALNLNEDFQSSFCWSPAIPAKPEPHLYLLALATLGLEPSSVVALEDSRTGLEAAQAARVPVICISDRVNMVEFCHEKGIPRVDTAASLIGVPVDEWLDRIGERATP